MEQELYIYRIVSDKYNNNIYKYFAFLVENLVVSVNDIRTYEKSMEHWNADEGFSRTIRNL